MSGNGGCRAGQGLQRTAEYSRSKGRSGAAVAGGTIIMATVKKGNIYSGRESKGRRAKVELQWPVELLQIVAE